MTAIAIPESVIVIDPECFKDCGHLASVIFEPGSKLRGDLADLLSGKALVASANGQE
jgi:hypothetical protein